MKNGIFIGLGTNLGQRDQNLENAIELIEEKIGKVERKSSIYETPPWGFESDLTFFNQCIEIATELEANAILILLLSIENEMGRLRSSDGKYISRIIDLDLLAFQDQVIKTKNLTLPHPGIHERNFVLVPLAEIAPKWIHPILGQPIQELLSSAEDAGFVRKIDL